MAVLRQIIIIVALIGASFFFFNDRSLKTGKGTYKNYESHKIPALSKRNSLGLGICAVALVVAFSMGFFV